MLFILLLQIATWGVPGTTVYKSDYVIIKQTGDDYTAFFNFNPKFDPKLYYSVRPALRIGGQHVNMIWFDTTLDWESTERVFKNIFKFDYVNIKP